MFITAIERRRCLLSSSFKCQFGIIYFDIFFKNSNNHILSKTILPVSLLLCDNLPLLGFFISYVNHHILVIDIVLLDLFKKKLRIMYTKVIVFYLLCGLLIKVKKIPFSEISLTFILVLLPVRVPNLL